VELDASYAPNGSHSTNTNGIARQTTNNLNKLEQLARTEHWVHCPACAQLIERTGGCNHMSHFKAQGCRGGVGEDKEATHFCSLCKMVLFGPHHKTEPDGETVHFPWGLFKDCRVVAAQKAGVDVHKYFPGPDDPYPEDKITQKRQPAVARLPPLLDWDRCWRNSMFCCCLSTPCLGGEGCPSREVCLTGVCCPCYLGSANVEQLTGEGRKLACACYILCYPFYAPLWRFRIRRMFGLYGCLLCDMLTTYLCPCASVIQEYGELQSRANQPHRGAGEDPPVDQDMI